MMPDGTSINMAQPAQLIEKYIQLRDKIKEIKDLHKKQLEPYGQALARLEALLLTALDTAGVENMRARSGTVYKAVSTSVTVQDWPIALGFIQETGLWDLLEARVSKTAAVQTIEELGRPIPGVAVAQAVTLHVRRAG
jgi:hypothetical protein